MRTLLNKLRYLLHRARFEQEMEEELRHHRELAAGGAHRFGNETQVREQYREAWSWAWLEHTLQDARYALRTMNANRVFTAMAVASLALGIGANTAIYSFLDAVLLRALPVAEPERLVVLSWQAKSDFPGVVEGHWGETYDVKGGGMQSPNFPYAAMAALQQAQKTEPVFGHARANRLNVFVNGEAGIVEGQYVTGGYFGSLRVGAATGRLISPEDDRETAAPVVTLSYDFWRTRLASDPAVPGKTMRINGTAFTITGVAAPEFFGVMPDSKPAVFLPAAGIGRTDPRSQWGEKLRDPHFYWIELMARLKPGVTMPEAGAELAGMFQRYVSGTAVKEEHRADLPRLLLQEGGSGVDALRRELSQPLWTLMGMVGLILAIVCANVANLLLARATSRRREMAVRLSLGAGRGRVIRQMLTESVMLALAGAAAGTAVAVGTIRLLKTLANTGERTMSMAVGIDARVLLYTTAVAVAAGLLFGLAPAWQATGVSVSSGLKETRAGEPRGRLGLRLSHVLVAAQIAFSLVLVAAAGLFARTLGNLHSVSLGFRAENLLLFSLDAEKAGYKGDDLKQFYLKVQNRLAAIPGVIGATSSDMPLVGGYASTTRFAGPGVPEPVKGQRGPSTSLAAVGKDFFATMEIPLEAGRPLDGRDVGGAPVVAVVNRVLADKYFPGRNPLGLRVKVGGRESGIEVEIVGVAKSIRYNSLKREVPPVTYLAWAQTQGNRNLQEMYFEVRTTGDPLELARAVRQQVRQLDAAVPVDKLTTQQDRIEETIAQERIFAQLCSAFGLLALTMACLGLYGTMAWTVARRTGEIGVRMALGAARGRLAWMVLRDALTVCAAGILVGLGGVIATTRLVEAQLFGVRANDPATITAAAGLLAACATIAAYLPARRASRVDPMTALRHE